MTKTQFMRDAKNRNMVLTLVEGKNIEFFRENRPGNLEPRPVCKVRTNSICLLTSGRESYLEIPAASLVEYDGECLTLFCPILREMTPEEQNNVNTWEKMQNEIMEKEPYTNTYWRRKDFFMKCSTPWVDWTSDKVQGRRAAQGGDYGKIWDDHIRGEVDLKYKVTFTS